MSTNQDATSAEVSRVWLARAGRDGGDESTALENNLAIIGFVQVADLSHPVDRGDFTAKVARAYEGDSKSKVSNSAAQLYAFAHRMRKGDIVALPLKTSGGRVALGRVEGAYSYKDVDGARRHTRPVSWVRKDVPRSDIGQDLLYSLGAFLTVCEIRRNDARRRFSAILNGDSDPELEWHGQQSLDDPREAPLNVAEIARDQIVDHIRSRFTGHDLSHLVAAVLEADGYSTKVSSPGPDGGVDILAGRGPVGFDAPRLCVQVKSSQGPIDVSVLRSLQGTMQNFSADHGLLVSWGGFTKSLESEARQNYFSVRLWNAADLIREVLRTYEHLPAVIRTEVPLKRIYAIVPPGEDHE